jgi:hypothetical protein
MRSSHPGPPAPFPPDAVAALFQPGIATCLRSLCIPAFPLTLQLFGERLAVVVLSGDDKHGRRGCGGHASFVDRNWIRSSLR